MLYIQFLNECEPSLLRYGVIPQRARTAETRVDLYRLLQRRDFSRVCLEPCTFHLKLSEPVVSLVIIKSSLLWPTFFLRDLCQVMNNASSKHRVVQSV